MSMKKHAIATEMGGCPLSDAMNELLKIGVRETQRPTQSFLCASATVTANLVIQQAKDY